MPHPFPGPVHEWQCGHGSPEALARAHPEGPAVPHQRNRRDENAQEEETQAERSRNAGEHLPREEGRPGVASFVIFTLWCEGPSVQV